MSENFMFVLDINVCTYCTYYRYVYVQCMHVVAKSACISARM
jgi:hypothetical protein